MTFKASAEKTKPFRHGCCCASRLCVSMWSAVSPSAQVCVGVCIRAGEMLIVTAPDVCQRLPLFRYSPKHRQPQPQWERRSQEKRKVFISSCLKRHRPNKAFIIIDSFNRVSVRAALSGAHRNVLFLLFNSHLPPPPCRYSENLVVFKNTKNKHKKRGLVKPQRSNNQSKSFG